MVFLHGGNPNHTNNCFFFRERWHAMGAAATEEVWDCRFMIEQRFSLHAFSSGRGGREAMSGSFLLAALNILSPSLNKFVFLIK